MHDHILFVSLTIEALLGKWQHNHKHNIVYNPEKAILHIDYQKTLYWYLFSIIV